MLREVYEYAFNGCEKNEYMADCWFRAVVFAEMLRGNEDRDELPITYSVKIIKGMIMRNTEKRYYLETNDGYFLVLRALLGMSRLKEKQADYLDRFRNKIETYVTLDMCQMLYAPIMDNPTIEELGMKLEIASTSSFVRVQPSKLGYRCYNMKYVCTKDEKLLSCYVPNKGVGFYFMDEEYVCSDNVVFSPLGNIAFVKNLGGNLFFPFALVNGNEGKSKYDYRLVRASDYEHFMGVVRKNLLLN